jgi:hypothetical protein
VAKILKIVPPETPNFRTKLDRLATKLVDALIDGDVPTVEMIAGLKALAAYHAGKGGDAVRSAFDSYRAAQVANDATEDES